MSTPSEYTAPTPDEIADFCETLRERMTEAAERSTLDITATFSWGNTIVALGPDGPEHEHDGSWELTIRAGPTLVTAEALRKAIIRVRARKLAALLSPKEEG